VVTIRKDKTVYLGKMLIPWDKVEETLRSNEKLKVDREVYLHADENLLYKDVIAIMAIMKLAGADKLGMITDPLE
jgi:biopolymer transport protein ExbD